MAVLSFGWVFYCGCIRLPLCLGLRLFGLLRLGVWIWDWYKTVIWWFLVVLGFCSGDGGIDWLDLLWYICVCILVFRIFACLSGCGTWWFWFCEFAGGLLWSVVWLFLGIIWGIVLWLRYFGVFVILVFWLYFIVFVWFSAFCYVLWFKLM